MKRSTAFRLLLTLLLLLGAYALWGLRPFLLRPEIRFEKGVPPQARQAVLRWYETSAFPESEPFGWKRYFDALCHPYQTTPPPVTVKAHGNKTLTATQESPRYTRFNKSCDFVQITRKSKDWSTTRVDEVSWKSTNLMGNKITERQRRAMDQPIPDGIPTD